MNEAVITGIGETPVGKLPGYEATQLQTWAAHEAILDAGLQLSDIDGLINQDPYINPQSMFALNLTEYLGIRPTWVQTCDVGGSVTLMTMIQTAIWAVSQGHCRHCLVLHGENTLTARPANSKGVVQVVHQGGDSFKEPYGVQGQVIAYSLVAQRYLHETGSTERDFGAVAVQMRKNALRNPNRQTRDPMSMDDYLASPMIVEPLRKADCCLVSDGAVAFVVSARSDVRRHDRPAVQVRSFAMQASHASIVQQPDLSDLVLPGVAKRAFARANLSVDDMDLFFVHDAFTVAVLLQIEGLGVCEPGKAGALFARGDADIHGRFPVNPHGGLLSQAHFGGGAHPVEAVRQLRGEAGDRQVPNARRAMWCGNGSVLAVFGNMILERMDA